MFIPQDYVASFFETTIRYLGGLLGAYELSRDKLYLHKAKELADLLMFSFESTPSGLPQSTLNMHAHKAQNHRWAGASILAEVGSVQLEFAYLSHHLNDPKYNTVARKVMDTLDKMQKDIPGLYPVYINPTTQTFTNHHITLGSFGDSWYEYLLKLWLLTDREDQEVLRMYNEAMEAVQKHMIKTKKVSYKDEQGNAKGNVVTVLCTSISGTTPSSCHATRCWYAHSLIALAYFVAWLASSRLGVLG